MPRKPLYLLCLILITCTSQIQAQSLSVSFHHYYKFYGDPNPEFDLYRIDGGTLKPGDRIVQTRTSGEDPGVYPLTARILRGNADVSSEYSTMLQGGSLTILGLSSTDGTDLSGGVTIGTMSDAAQGALLQLKENDNLSVNATKGLLFPLVKLTVLTDLRDVGSELNKKDHIGLVVYNVNEDTSVSLQKGLYVWDGNKWRKVRDF